MSPIGHALPDPLWDYIQEREYIRLRKAECRLPPWTDDPILAGYKFTNVKRIHDRTTQAFLKTYQENREAPAHVALYNCAARRFTGTVAAGTAMGWLPGFRVGALSKAEAKCKADNQMFWTGAYMVRGGAAGVPKATAVEDYLSSIWGKAKAITSAIESTGTWEAGYEIMHTCYGCGGNGFMVKEVLQDYLLWKLPWIPVDNETWTPIGPGARRGLNRLAGRPLAANLRDEDFLAEIRDHLKRIQTQWLKTFKGHPRLTAHDIQFCLCEVDKYLRVKTGEGRPRSKYQPRGIANCTNTDGIAYEAKRKALDPTYWGK